MHSFSRLSSPRLVRLLQDWSPLAEEPSRQDAAERLSQWLGAFDTVTLDGALQAIEAYPTQTKRVGNPVAVGALVAAVSQAEAEMRAMIDEAPAVASMADFAPHHQRYLALQKRMDQRIAALRQAVRHALAAGAPRWRQLCALDATMAQLLDTHAQRLLSSVPLFLERRFDHWRQVAAQEDGAPNAFARDVRDMLHAEMQVRLQPVLGLVAALRHEISENREQA